MEHKSNISETFETIQELANAIGDLRYDALRDFLRSLHHKLSEDSKKDEENGRSHLAFYLKTASTKLLGSYFAIQSAWIISEPHITSEIFKVDDEIIYTIYHSGLKTEILGKIIRINNSEIRNFNETVDIEINNIDPTLSNQIIRFIPIKQIKKYE